MTDGNGNFEVGLGIGFPDRRIIGLRLGRTTTCASLLGN